MKRYGGPNRRNHWQRWWPILAVFIPLMAVMGGTMFTNYVSEKSNEAVMQDKISDLETAVVQLQQSVEACKKP